MRRLVVKVLKNETILVVASVLALVSCFIVPPDREYAGYIHASTISQLICLMIVVCGFQRIGVFRIIGSRLLEHVGSLRGLVVTLVALTYFSAMLITNDVALVTFVPFAVAVLLMADMGERTVLVVTLMTTSNHLPSPLVNGVAVRPMTIEDFCSMRFLCVVCSTCASSKTSTDVSGQRRRPNVCTLQICSGSAGRQRSCPP